MYCGKRDVTGHQMTFSFNSVCKEGSLSATGVTKWILNFKFEVCELCSYC